MSNDQVRILIVENDPIISNLIARQALGNQGFDIKIETEAASAIRQAMTFSPDVVIANIELPGLSGKDLMVALASQNVQIPVIMIAGQGQEKDVIQAFRVGASDHVGSPIREAEVVSAVERALKTVRARKERQKLSRQLESTNQELNQRVNELTTIFGVGKAVTSITDQKKLFDEVIKGAVSITQADYGWLLIMKERTNEFILRAQVNLPKSLLANMDKPWDDGISSLVARSGEPFSIFGDSFEQFMLSSLGKSALVVPVKIQRQTVALLVVMRKPAKEFSASDHAMLEAVSDYAAISLVNARLFRALDERAAQLQTDVDRSKGSEQVKEEIIQNVRNELKKTMETAKEYIDLLVGDQGKNFSKEQKDALLITQQKLARVEEIVEVMNLMYETAAPKEVKRLFLNDLLTEAYVTAKTQADQEKIMLLPDLPPEKVYISGDYKQISMVFDALLSNAIKFSSKESEVSLRLRRTPENLAHVSIADQGIGISKKNLDKVFTRFYQIKGSQTNKNGGIGIGLALVKEIIESHGGKVWVESKLEQGSIFHFTLPTAE